MTTWALLALAAVSARAAVIRGTVVEHQTGRPLAHTIVVSTPVAGTPGTMLSVKTNDSGAFQFPTLSGGAYLISASRRGFAPVMYGQKRFRAAGVPVVLDEAASTTLTIRLHHFGGITGMVADENDVGMPEHDVVAFRNTKPLQMAGRGRTDDRGAFRIGGLEPGAYLIRTLSKQDGEDSYLPTFSRETTRAGEARLYEVSLDEQTPDAHVRPVPGRLVTVGGRLTPSPMGPATVTLISDAGTEITVSDSRGEFQFKPVAPGPYELFAQATLDRRYGGGGAVAGYQSLTVERDRTDVRLTLSALPALEVQIEDAKGQPIDARSVQLLARRKDLSGETAAFTLGLSGGKTPLLPGRWDLALAWMPGYYVASFSGPGMAAGERGRADGWNELVLTSGASAVKFALSPSPGAVHGVVTVNGEPASGAPVFLEAYDAVLHRRLSDLRTARTDIQGQYRFYGLAPGSYRILSSFEFQNPDSADLDAAKARLVETEESRDLAQDLELYVIR